MRDFLRWRIAPLVSSFCLLAAAAKPAAAQTPAPPAAAAPQAAPQLAAPPPAPPGAAPAPQYPAGYPPPPGYPYPAYGAYPQPMRMPDSAPYTGGPVPTGYHVEERPRRGLVIAGTIVLAVPYGLGLAVAGGQNFPNSSGWLIVPGVGPWLTLLTRHKSSGCTNDSSGFSDCVDAGLDDTTRTFLIIDGLMQTGGAVMLIAGIASPKKVIARDFVGSLHFTPSPIGRTGYGGFVTGSF